MKVSEINMPFLKQRHQICCNVLIFVSNQQNISHPEINYQYYVRAQSIKSRDCWCINVISTIKRFHISRMTRCVAQNYLGSQDNLTLISSVDICSQY